MKWLIPFVFIINAEARVISSSDVTPKELSSHGSIVVGSIWQNLGWPQKETPKFEPTPAPVPSPAPRPNPKPSPKKPSKGQLAIERMLKKNRERLKSKSLDKKQEQSLTLKEQYLENLNKMKMKNQRTLSGWAKQRDETLKHWKKKQAEFLSQLEDFKKAQFNFESPAFPVRSSKLKKPVVIPVKEKFHVIPGAFDLAIKNQGKRPTCAAFAGIRAIETLLAANGQQADLSEQYLYWAAKPTCQQSPCSKRGSWVSRPFKKSSHLNYPDIPNEKSCPYSSYDRPANQTHTPLKVGCKEGSVQVKSFKGVETLDEVVLALKSNQPVVAGFKLSPNFYENNGLITYSNSKSSGKMDGHANGHALLLIGYIKLPPELLKRGEGKVCFLAANSWGEGWGQGGYSCLTERWVRHHRIKNAFMALDSANIK